MLINLPNAYTKEQLPENALTISRNQISTWERCPYKWHLTYTMGLRGLPSKQMRLGTSIHHYWQHYYSRFLGSTVHPLNSSELWEIFEAADASIEPSYEDQIAAIRSKTLLSKFVGYSVIHDDFTVLAVEQELYVFLDLEIEGRPVFAHGFPDLVVETSDGLIGVHDHKSGGRAWTDDLVYFDAQLPYYMMMLDMMGVTPQYGAIDNINTYDYKKLAEVPVDKLFSRVYAYHNKVRLMHYRTYIIEKIRRMYDQAKAMKNLSRDCAYCSFRDICNTELRGIDSSGMIANFGQADNLTIDLDLGDFDAES